jgi:signal transduction histidine kinase
LTSLASKRVPTADNAARDFFLMFAHELRSPLSAADGAIFLIRRKLMQALPEGSVELANLLQLQSNALKSIRELVERVIQFKSIEVPSNREEVDLVATATGWFRAPGSPMNDPRVRLELTLPDKFPIRTEPALLKLLAEEIVQNGLRFSADPMPVIVRIAVAGEGWTLCVIDHGRGVPAAEVPRLGEPFFQASNAGDLPAPGLGLAIVRRIAAGFGATVSWDTQQGGTSCVVTFPASSRAAPPRT